jgi:outer membrane protein assembly factor BamD (BamD/ComL family)
MIQSILKTRKVIVFIIVVLVVLYGTLSLANIGSEFTAEKLLYTTLRAYYTMPPMGDDSMMGEQAEIKDSLRKIITRFPKSMSARHAYVNLATLCLETENYDEALSVADDILRQYKLNAYLSAEAHLLKAASYEKKGNLDKAVEEFKILHRDYTETRSGLRAPLYIAQFYERQNKHAEADEAYDAAIVFFEATEQKHRGRMLGYLASLYLIQTYMSIDFHGAAGQVVEDIIENYPESVLAEQLPYVELIYVKMLNSPEKAITLYERIANKTKHARLRDFVRKKIQELEQD